MPIELIINYMFDAITFATKITIFYFSIYFTVLLLQKRTVDYKNFFLKFAFIFYLAMLLHITVIRNGIYLNNIGIHGFETISLVPLINLIDLLSNGGFFIYNVAGNLLWFVPLGFLLPYLYPHKNAFLHVLLVSFCLSCSIEVMQWLCANGISDINDVILNTLGAAGGYRIRKFKFFINTGRK